MKANLILMYLDQKDYDTLRKKAEDELSVEHARQKGGTSEVQRLKAMKKLLNGYTVWDDNGLQCFCTAQMALMLSSRFELPQVTTSRSIKEYFRDVPGQEVDVDWDKVETAIELAKPYRNTKRHRLAKLKDVYVNLHYLHQVRTILGGKCVHVFIENPLSSIQMENENGKAIIMPVRRSEKDGTPVVDVTRPGADEVAA